MIFSSLWEQNVFHPKHQSPKQVVCPLTGTIYNSNQGYWCVQIVVRRRLLRVPRTARRFNQSILKELSPESSLEGLTLKLATRWELTHWKRPRCCERLRVGGEGDDRKWDGWMASSTQWTWVWVNSRSWWWTGKPGLLQSMESQRVEHNWVNWTELNWTEG